MKEWHLLSILTPVRLDTNTNLARGFLDLLSDMDVFPEGVSDHEPVRMPVSSVDEALRLWRDPFLWKRKSPPAMDGSVFSTWQENHDAICVEVAATAKGAAAALQTLMRLPRLFPVDLGSLHFVGDVEIMEKQRDENASSCLQLGPATHILRKGLPDPTWAMLFGAPYVELIGKECLLSAPAHCIDEVAENHILVQLTPDIDDVRKNYPFFKERRAAFKEHVGREFFMRLKGEDHEVRAPEFRFVGKIPFHRS